MALSRLTSSDVGAFAREKINAALEGVDTLAEQRQALDQKVNSLNAARASEIAELAGLARPQPAINSGLQRQISELLATVSPQPAINAALQAQIGDAFNRIAGQGVGLTDVAAGLAAVRNIIAVAPDGMSSVSRPGDGRLGFSLLSSVSSFSGSSAGLPPLPASALSQTDQGAAIDIRGSGIVGARRERAIEPGRVYEVRAVLRRRANPSDPNNDRVRVLALWLDAAKNLLPTQPFSVVKDLTDLDVALGRVEVSAFVGRAPASNALIVAPGHARHFRLAVQSFGLDGVTSIETLEDRDATGLPVPTADGSPELAARVTAIEGQDLARKVATLQSQLQAPDSLTFPTMTDAASATIPPSVTTLDVRGAATPGDGGGRLHVRVADLGGQPGFRSQDGSYWQRLVGRAVLDDVSDAKAFGAIGNGVAFDSTALLALAQDLSDRGRNPFGKRGFLPVGLYKSDKKITVTLTGSQIGQLACDGRHSARIIFTNPRDCGLEVLIAKQLGISEGLCQAAVLSGFTLLCDFKVSDIPGGGRLAGTALRLAFAPGDGVIASPLPSVTVENVSIGNVRVPAIEAGFGGWAVHYECDSLNITNTLNLNFDKMVYGSTGIIHDTDGSPSVIHTHQNVVMNGECALGVKIGKDGNDVPLQGFIFDNPTIVSTHPQAVGYDVRAKYAATNAVGDHLDVRGGHHNVWKLARIDGWRQASIDTYALISAGGIGVHALNSAGPISVKGTWNLQGDGSSRAVVLDSVSGAEDSNYDINIQVVRAIVPPVLLRGTTRNGFSRGTVASRVVYVPLVEDQTGLAGNFWDCYCNGIRRVSQAIRGDASEAIATTAWVRQNGTQISGRVGVSANATLGAGHVNKIALLLVPVSVTLPDPLLYPGSAFHLENRSGTNCNMLGAGIEAAAQPVINNEIVTVQAFDGQWSIVRRGNRLGSPSR